MSITQLMDQLDNPNLKVGDTVVLKSGGPKMTIVRVSDDKVEAVWFDDDADVQNAEFPHQALEEVG